MFIIVVTYIPDQNVFNVGDGGSLRIILLRRK